MFIMEIKDPRPDLEEDSDLWIIVLSVMLYEDETLHNKFVEFRKAGCRLSMNRDRRSIAFNFGDEADEQIKETIKQQAKEHSVHIKSLFRRAFVGIAKSEKK